MEQRPKQTVHGQQQRVQLVRAAAAPRPMETRMVAVDE